MKRVHDRLICCRLVALIAVVSCAPMLIAQQPFTEEAVSRGLIYQMQNYPQSQGYTGFGSAFSDLDGDGDADIVLVGSASGLVGLFENDGTGQFTDRSAGSGIPLLTEASGVSVADFDADGRPDIYLTQVAAADLLLRNNGGFMFTDVTAAAGMGDLGSGKGSAWGDLDGDGHLEIYTCNYNGIVPGTENLDNRLYYNNGDTTFADISVAQAVDNNGRGYQSLWFDYDLDGDDDLYLSNDRAELSPFEPNHLWRNDNGTLVDVSAASNADIAIDSMGIGCGDFDGNGYLDLYCTNVPGVGGENNVLLLNQGNGTFTNSTGLAGIGNGFGGTSWGAVFFDVDNSGTLDLYVNNQFVPNTLYINPGFFPCTERANAYGVQGNGGVSFHSAVADIDNDGDLDLMVNDLSHNVQLFINHEGETRDYIRYRMVGEGLNTQAIGGRTTTTTSLASRIRHVRAGGNSYIGQNELIMHVGLGSESTVDVEAVWPGGSPTRTLTDLPTNATWNLYPPSRLGDVDDNGQVTPADFYVLVSCYQQAFVPGCEIMDFDGDSDVDDDDYASFVSALSGEPGDCNMNGQPDLEEILADPNLDLDGNGVLDVCMAVPAAGAWGMALLVLMTLVGATLVFGRQERRLRARVRVSCDRESWRR